MSINSTNVLTTVSGTASQIGSFSSQLTSLDITTASSSLIPFTTFESSELLFTTSQPTTTTDAAESTSPTSSNDATTTASVDSSIYRSSIISQISTENSATPAVTQSSTLATTGEDSSIIITATSTTSDETLSSPVSVASDATTTSLEELVTSDVTSTTEQSEASTTATASATTTTSIPAESTTTPLTTITSGTSSELVSSQASGNTGSTVSTVSATISSSQESSVDTSTIATEKSTASSSAGPSVTSTTSFTGRSSSTSSKTTTMQPTSTFSSTTTTSFSPITYTRTQTMVLFMTSLGKTATLTSVTVQLFTLTPTFDTRTATGALATESFIIPVPSAIAKDAGDSSVSTGTIVGAVIGSVAGAALICLFLLLFWKSRKKKHQQYLEKDATFQDREIMRQYGGVGTTNGGSGGVSRYNNFNASLPSISDHHAAARAATESGEIQAMGTVDGGSGRGGFLKRLLPVGLFSRGGPGKPPSSVGSAANSNRTSTGARAAGTRAIEADAVDNPRSFYRQPRRQSVAATGSAGADTNTTATMTSGGSQSVGNYGSVPIPPSGDVFHDDNRLTYSNNNNAQLASYHPQQQNEQPGYKEHSNSTSLSSQDWAHVGVAPPTKGPARQYNGKYGRRVVNADGHEDHSTGTTPTSPMSTSASEERENSQVRGQSFFTEDL